MIERLSCFTRVATVVALVVLFQVTLVSQLRIGKVSPDIALLLAVATGVANGPDRGAIVGFAVGISYDIFLDTPFGLSALISTLVAYAAGSVQVPLATHPQWWRAMSVAVASATGVLLWLAAQVMLDLDQLRGYSLLRIALVVAAVNALATPLALRVATWMFKPLASRTALAAP